MIRRRIGPAEEIQRKVDKLFIPNEIIGASK
jgi:hypothetical protein